MFQILRNSKLLRILWLLIGLYFFNICIDTNDLTSSDLPENLEINDQESIVELLVEKVMGFDNAFPEYDDNDSKGKKTNQSKDFKVKPFRTTPISFTNFNPVKILLSFFNFRYNRNLLSGHYKSYSPPPEISL